MEDILRRMVLNDEPGHPMPEDVKRMELRRIVDALGEPPVAFERGDFLEHKYPGLSNEIASEVPAIFVRYLDEPLRSYLHCRSVQELRSYCAALELDCVIAIIQDEKYVEYFSRSSDFRRASNQEV